MVGSLGLSRFIARLVVLGCCAGGLVGCGHGAPPPASSAPSRGPTAEELFAQGWGAWERGDGIRAEQYLTLALDRGMPKERVLPLLIHIGLASARLRGVLNHAEPYLFEHPDDDALRCLVATVHMSLGQRNEAGEQLDRLLLRNDSYADAHYLKGILMQETMPSLARGHFERYLELAPAGAHAREVKSHLEGLEARREAKHHPEGLEARREPKHHPEGLEARREALLTEEAR